jgi:hypothetical protein
MAHLYNRNAFANGISLSAPLLSTYCQLCCVEMLLVQYLNRNGIPQKGTHDIPVLLTTLASQSGIKPSDVGTINGLSSELMTKLTALKCQGVKSIGNVRASQYPDMRYVRHDSDFATQSSTTSDITALQAHVQHIYATLLTITKEPV